GKGRGRGMQGRGRRLSQSGTGRGGRRGSCVRYRAGTGDTMPADEKYPAAEAQLATVLFSSLVNSLLTAPILRSTANSENARMVAVIAIPRLQPTLRPMYRFDTDMTPPRNMPATIARTVSCGASGL